MRHEINIRVMKEVKAEVCKMDNDTYYPDILANEELLSDCDGGQEAIQQKTDGFTCSECDHTFTSDSKLTNHILDVHEKSFSKSDSIAKKVKKTSRTNFPSDERNETYPSKRSSIETCKRWPQDWRGSWTTACV